MGYEWTMQQLSQAVDACRAFATQMAPYDVVFRRDPMRALVDAHGELVASSGMHGGLSVQGIIWSPEHPMVVIDDELFAQGAAVGPYTIVEIQPEGVIVQRGAERLFIPLDRGLEVSQPVVTPAPAPAASPSSGETPPSPIIWQ